MRSCRLRRAGIAGLVALMLLMAAAGLCGQHFCEVETAPVIGGGYRDYVKGVYIVKNGE